MEKAGIILGVVVLWIFIALLMAYPTMWCWNYLMPKLFGLVQIHWFDALVINIFCSILFKGSSKSS